MSRGRPGGVSGHPWPLRATPSGREQGHDHRLISRDPSPGATLVSAWGGRSPICDPNASGKMPEAFVFAGPWHAWVVISDHGHPVSLQEPRRPVMEDPSEGAACPCPEHQRRVRGAATPAAATSAPGSSCRRRPIWRPPPSSRMTARACSGCKAGIGCHPRSSDRWCRSCAAPCSSNPGPRRSFCPGCGSAPTIERWCGPWLVVRRRNGAGAPRSARQAPTGSL
jgi:hypothetical protein